MWFLIEFDGNPKWVPYWKSKSLAECVFLAEIRKMLDTLNSLVGLAEFKEKMFGKYAKALVNTMKLETMETESFPIPTLCLLGEPGTGKTTCMRLMGSLFWLAGLLPFGHLPLDDTEERPWRSNEITHGTVGVTATLVGVAARDALGGVLAIDEAHQLARGTGYGKDAIDALIPLISEHARDMLVIFGGYKKQMDEFMKYDGGLDSRFDSIIELPRYTSEELVQICSNVLTKNGFQLSGDVVSALNACFSASADWSWTFGNARACESIAQQIWFNHRSSSIFNELLTGAEVEETFRAWHAKRGIFGNQMDQEDCSSFNEALHQMRLQIKDADSMVQFDKAVREKGQITGEMCPMCKKPTIVRAFSEFRCTECTFFQVAHCFHCHLPAISPGQISCTRCKQTADAPFVVAADKRHNNQALHVAVFNGRSVPTPHDLGLVKDVSKRNTSAVARGPVKKKAKPIPELLKGEDIADIKSVAKRVTCTNDNPVVEVSVHIIKVGNKWYYAQCELRKCKKGTLISGGLLSQIPKSFKVKRAALDKLKKAGVCLNTNQLNNVNLIEVDQPTLLKAIF